MTAGLEGVVGDGAGLDGTGTLIVDGDVGDHLTLRGGTATVSGNVVLYGSGSGFTVSGGTLSAGGLLRSDGTGLNMTGGSLSVAGRYGSGCQRPALSCHDGGGPGSGSISEVRIAASVSAR